MKMYNKVLAKIKGKEHVYYIADNVAGNVAGNDKSKSNAHIILPVEYLN